MVIGPAFGQKSARQKVRKQVEKLVWFETDIDGERTPGFLLALIDGPSTMVLPFGVRQKDTEDTIRIDDVFELGSITKVFTATLFAELDRRGALSLDSSFNSFVDKRYRNPRLADISIADMLAHQSGLPRDPVRGSRLGNQLRHYASFTREDLLREYRDFDGTRRMVYSNLGYALLAEALPEEYDWMLREYILEPNAMDHTCVETDSIAPGYGVYDTIAGPTRFGPFGTSGGLKSSMSDMIAFVRYCFEEAPGSVWQDRGEGMTPDLRMALGWHYLEQKNGRVYVHTGHTLGHTAFIGLCPATSTAVVIMANSFEGTDDLGMEVLRIMNKNWNRKS